MQIFWLHWERFSEEDNHRNYKHWTIVKSVPLLVSSKLFHQNLWLLFHVLMYCSELMRTLVTTKWEQSCSRSTRRRKATQLYFAPVSPTRTRKTTQSRKMNVKSLYGRNISFGVIFEGRNSPYTPTMHREDDCYKYPSQTADLYDGVCAFANWLLISGTKKDFLILNLTPFFASDHWVEQLFQSTRTS